jgi:hypothetical protein
MYSDRIVSPGQVVEPVRPRVQKPVWLRTPSLAAIVAGVILAAAVVLALTLGSGGRVHTAFHKAPPAAQPAPRFTPPLVPNGYIRVPNTHQLIPLH